MTDCPDCGVEVGQVHDRGCDVARCLWTGGQALQCVGGLIAECCKALRDSGHSDLAEELALYEDLDDPAHDCGDDVWIGEWPGDIDARALGFWCRWGPPWIPCNPDHPDARPDLNRLAVEAKWDRSSKAWLAR